METFEGLIFLVLVIFASSLVAMPIVQPAVLVTALLWNLFEHLFRYKRPISVRPDSRDEPSPTIVVTLIHGTWAPKASWTQDDSAICRSVRGALPDNNVTFVPFCWSGHNSISARYKAGEELAKYMRSFIEKWPLARHIIIAHSHGGSVALSGLRHVDVREPVIGVVCLSTPFLIAVRRPVTLIGRSGLSITPALIFAFGLGGILNILQLAPIIERYESLESLFGLFVIVGAITIAYKTPRIVKSLAEELLAKMQLAELEEDRLLIVRFPGDEASAALGAMQILNFVVSRIWDNASYLLEDCLLRMEQWASLLRSLGWRLHVFNLILIVSTAMLVDKVPKMYGINTFCLVLSGTASLLWSVWCGSALLALVGIPLLGILAAPLPILLAVLALPFGPELAIVSLVLNVTAEATPIGPWGLRQLSPATGFDLHAKTRPGLTHSRSYDDHVALTQLANWVQQRVAACAAASLGPSSNR